MYLSVTSDRLFALRDTELHVRISVADISRRGRDGNGKREHNHRAIPWCDGFPSTLRPATISLSFGIAVNIRTTYSVELINFRALSDFGLVGNNSMCTPDTKHPRSRRRCRNEMRHCRVPFYSRSATIIILYFARRRLHVCVLFVTCIVLVHYLTADFGSRQGWLIAMLIGNVLNRWIKAINEITI